MRMLIAEDDPALAGFMKKGLEAEHYAVDVSADGERARALASELNYDLMVLDLSLPKLDGVAILRHLRTRKPSMPILVLTGRQRVEDRVLCLDLGADDYLVKPFSFSELSARIRALLRRSHLPAESVLAVDDLKLDRVERRVERAGRRIDLTSKEFTLLEYLMRNAGRRVTRAMIIEHVWNLSFDTCTNVVDVYINYVTAQRVFYGNGVNQTQSQQTYLSTANVSLAQQQNSVAGADVATVASQLVQDETARTAALDAIAKTPQTSLFDYLK
jgi:two-component system, OmpR family, copper resistance phosphate regulon response regulator CusR